MPTQLENITTKLQSALDKANALPEAIELDELSNPGSAATMLEGTEMLDAEGKKVTGTIETKTEDDLTINGRYVVVPVGYYAEEASKTINDATIPDPVITVDANGKITATTITGKAGFVASEMEYTSTKQLSTQASKTITPTKSSQTAVESGKYTTGAVSVGPIPDEYADVSGVTAKTEDVIVGTTFVDTTGAEQTGKLNTSTIKVLNSERTGAFEIPVDSRLNIVDQTYLIVQPAEELFGTTNTSKVLSGETFTSFDGRAQVGTMPNNGDTSTTIDGLETQSVTIPTGYTSGGTVALDSTINDTANSQAAQIAEIAALLEGKSVPGGGTGVETCTVTVNNMGLLGHVLYQTYAAGVYTPVCYVPPHNLESFTFETIKGQTVFFTGSDSDINDTTLSDNAEKMYNGYGENDIGYVVAIRVNGDATIYI